ncbi:MAG: hypothetical protein LBC78_00755 [Oscillospiraceae bacterium]|nr:hypothetical protein [Oscillospiraceae bacterium]
MADAKFFFRSGDGAHVEATVTLRQEKHSAISGTVTTDGAKAAEDALVLLYRADDLEFLDRQFTDEDGRFIFGPLCGDELYLVKIHKPDLKPRELETKG